MNRKPNHAFIIHNPPMLNYAVENQKEIFLLMMCKFLSLKFLTYFMLEILGPGYSDGSVQNCRLLDPQSILVTDGNLYVGEETTNGGIRMLSFGVYTYY